MLTVLLTGCGNPETKIVVYNAGPQNLTNVNVVVGKTTHPLGTVKADEQKVVNIPAIQGKRVEVRYDNAPENAPEIVIQGELKENKYGEINVGIKDLRREMVLSGHAP